MNEVVVGLSITVRASLMILGRNDVERCIDDVNRLTLTTNRMKQIQMATTQTWC